MTYNAIGHDEAARQRIQSLEAYLKLAYCATHSVHFEPHPQLGTPMCPKRDPAEKCYVTVNGVPW